MHLAARLLQAYTLPLGANGSALIKEILPNKAAPQDIEPMQNELVRVVVCGAHLSGLSLNEQLTSRDARLVISITTPCDYKPYALHGSPQSGPD